MRGFWVKLAEHFFTTLFGALLTFALTHFNDIISNIPEADNVKYFAILGCIITPLGLIFGGFLFYNSVQTWRVYWSRHPHDSGVRHPLAWSIDQESQRALADRPSLD